MENLNRKPIFRDIDVKLYDRTSCVARLIYGITACKVTSSGKAKPRRFYLHEANNSLLVWTSNKRKRKHSIMRLNQLISIERSADPKCFKNYKSAINPLKTVTLTFKTSILGLIFNNTCELTQFLSGIWYILEDGFSILNYKSNTQEDPATLLYEVSESSKPNSLNELKNMMNSINLHPNHEEIQKILSDANIKSNILIDKKDFDQLLQNLLNNPPLNSLFTKYSDGSSYLSKKNFKKFMIESQGEANYKSLFLHFSENISGTPQISNEHFRDFLLNPELNSIFKSEHKSVCMEMNHPIAHYFISSSVLLDSRNPSIGNYHLALLEGCRHIDLLVCDGPDAPILLGPANILFSTILIEIRDSAFVSSAYPVFLSIKNRCSPTQTLHLLEILTETLTDSLHIPTSTMDSPETLKHKFILSGKSLDFDLLGLKPSKFSLENSSRSLVWMSAPKLKELLKTHTSGELIRNHSQSLTKLSPKPGNININPLDYWIFGTQIVSIDQTYNDTGKLINKSWFSSNANCGYVLKPSFMRDNLLCFDVLGDTLESSSMVIQIKLFSAFNLPLTKGSELSSPYVEVSTFGLPQDSKSYQSKAIKHNGINPIWNEEFKFNIRMIEMCVIVFKVFHAENNEMLAVSSVPLFYASTGVRAVQLMDKEFRVLKNSVLLCEINVDMELVDC